jgi:serine protein kinase
MSSCGGLSLARKTGAASAPSSQGRKNRDSTELTGDINYRKIASMARTPIPRLQLRRRIKHRQSRAYRFIEVLKLDVAFLYDLLGASQEHVIKPKKFAQTNIDEVIIGHTNEPEYKKLQNNELMEAFRDRTIKIDVPYNVILDQEIKIYEKDFNKERIRGMHIAPHTVEVAAMWAVLTRLEDPKKAGLSRLQSSSSTAARRSPAIRRIRSGTLRGKRGDARHQPAIHQDKISNSLVSDQAIQERASTRSWS